MGQWLTLCNPSSAQGQWYLHQLLLLLQAAPEHRWQDPYDTQPERLGAQSFRQLAPPALLQGLGQEALLQGAPPDAATAAQQRRRRDADEAEPDRTKCRVAAWTAACRLLTRDTTELRPYQPADRTALASTVAAVTMGPVAAWLAHLLPHIPCEDARPCQPARKHAPRAPLTAEQLNAIAAALLADGGESFVHHNTPAQIADSIQGPQSDAPQAPSAHPHQGHGSQSTPSGTPAGGGTGAAGGRLPGYPARPRWRLPVTRLGRRQVDHLAWHHQTTVLPARR